MITLGFIQAQKKSIQQKQIFLIPIVLKEFTDKDIVFVAAEPGVSADDMQKMSFLRRKIIEKRAQFLLKKKGVTFLCKEGNGTLQRKMCITDFMDATRFAFSYFDKNPRGKTALILDKKCIGCAESLLAEMIQKVERLNIITENIVAAEEVAEKICEQYGIYPEVIPWNHGFCGKHDFLLDVDAGKIRIGRDICIDGREYTMDLFGYSVDLVDLLKNYPELKDKLIHQAWLFGKKRLTR